MTTYQVVDALEALARKLPEAQEFSAMDPRQLLYRFDDGRATLVFADVMCEEATLARGLRPLVDELVRLSTPRRKS